VSRDLAYYEQQFTNLHPNRSSGYVKPHKACLILAVLDLIKKGVIVEKHIYLNETLKTEFTKHFGIYQHGSDKDDPAQPFFYLESSPFWSHKPFASHINEYHKRVEDRNHGSLKIVNRIIEFAVIDQDLFQYMRNPVARAILESALRDGLDDLRGRFERWALSVGKSKATVSNSSKAIYDSVSKWVRPAKIPCKDIFEINSYSEFLILCEQIKKLDKFTRDDVRANGMYSAALKLYGRFLADTTKHDLEEDIQQINDNTNLEITEKVVLVSARIGQGLFRQNLIKYWGGCAITGYSNSQILIASHIKPWKAAINEERLDTYNGVLLLPNLDKAFDIGFITFDEKGRLIVSSRLEEHYLLGIKNDMRVNLKDQHQDYMAYHREFVFEN
jgi:predicted restriction endonuclease